MSATYVSCAIHRGIVPREDAVAIDWENGDPARRRHVCSVCCRKLSPMPWRRGRPAITTIEQWRKRIDAAKVEVEPLIAAVAQVMRVDPAQMLGPSRTQRIAWARHVLMFLCREVKQWPWELVGAALGRNHSTVMYGHTLVRRRIAASFAFARTIEEIRAACADQEAPA